MRRPTTTTNSQWYLYLDLGIRYRNRRGYHDCIVDSRRECAKMAGTMVRCCICSGEGYAWPVRWFEKNRNLNTDVTSQAQVPQLRVPSPKEAVTGRHSPGAHSSRKRTLLRSLHAPCDARDSGKLNLLAGRTGGASTSCAVCLNLANRTSRASQPFCAPLARGKRRWPCAVARHYCTELMGWVVRAATWVQSKWWACPSHRRHKPN